MRKIYESKNFIKPDIDWKPKFSETYHTPSYYIENDVFHLLWGRVKIKNNSVIHEIKNIYTRDKIEIPFKNINQIIVHGGHTEQYHGRFYLHSENKIYQYPCIENLILFTALSIQDKPDISYFIDLDFCKKHSNTKIAEIGVKFGLSSHWMLKNMINCQIDLFEREPKVIDIINSQLQEYNDRYTLYFGDAQKSLLNINNKIYDIVFFDSSHKYEIDIQIFESLLPHIDENTLVIFDDYNITDVKKLVEYACKLKNFKLIV